VLDGPINRDAFQAYVEQPPGLGLGRQLGRAPGEGSVQRLA
jgi:hypothetical protein